MLLGQTEIAVPFLELGGDPTSFDPDWRLKVAELISSGFDDKKIPKQLKDKHVLAHARFLKAFKSKGDVDEIFAKYPINGLIMNWSAASAGSKTKHYLQALLLTDQPLNIIASDLRLDEKAVKLYCDLCFSCRSEADNYEMKLPMETRMTFAFGELSHDLRQIPTYVFWRVLAVRDGYTALVRLWGLENFAHGKLDEGMPAMDRNMHLSNIDIEQQLRSGTVGFRSLVEFQNAWMNYKKLQDNVDGRDGMSSPLYEMVGAMLAAVAPKLVSDLEAEGQKKAEAKSAKKKLLAEKNIELHNSDDDKSKALAEEFNKLKKEKFKLMDSTIGSKQ